MIQVLPSFLRANEQPSAVCLPSSAEVTKTLVCDRCACDWPRTPFRWQFRLLTRFHKTITSWSLALRIHLGVARELSLVWSIIHLVCPRTASSSTSRATLYRGGTHQATSRYPPSESFREQDWTTLTRRERLKTIDDLAYHAASSEISPWE